VFLFIYLLEIANMNIGMLWFDNDKMMDLNTKIERASNYYLKKYGKSPTLCYVHPSMLPTPPDNNSNGNGSKANNQKDHDDYYTGSVAVRSNQSILPNHFWLGFNGNS
jgi:hypothetical protein